MKRIFILITLVATLIQVSYAEDKSYESPRMTMDMFFGGNFAKHTHNVDPVVKNFNDGFSMGFSFSVELVRHFGVYGGISIAINHDDDNSLPPFLNENKKGSMVEINSGGPCFQTGIESRWDFGHFFVKPKVGIAGLKRSSENLQRFDYSATGTDMVQYDLKHNGSNWTGAVIPGIKIGYKIVKGGELFIDLQYRCLFSKRSYVLTVIDAYTGTELIKPRSFTTRNPINIDFGVSFPLWHWKK